MASSELKLFTSVRSLKKRIMNTFIVKVNAFWDSEVDVWVASSDNLPGLVTEASTIEVLTAKLKAMIPELIELNKVESGNKDYIDLYLTTHRHESIKVAD